ncbi:hypothetical protein AAMO2058_001186300 [Amorphochlora amoebiformis]
MRLTWALAVVLVLKTNWGIGMMAMPYLLKESGTVAGIVLFLVSLVMITDSCLKVGAAQKALRECFSSVDKVSMEAQQVISLDLKTRLLTVSQDAATVTDTPINSEDPSPDASSHEEDGERSPNLTTYVGIMEAGVGLWAARLAMGCISLGSVGSCIAYLRFIADNVNACFGVKAWKTLAVCGALLAPSQMLRDLRNFTFVSFFGVTFGVVFITLLVIKASELSPEHVLHKVSHSTLLKLESFPIGMGIAAFSSEGVIIIWPQVAHSLHLQNMSTMKAKSVVCTSMGIFALFYVVVGCCGYLIYGDDSLAEISVNMTKGTKHAVITANEVAALAYAVTLLLTFIIVSHLLYTAYEPYAEQHISVSTGLKRYLPAIFTAIRCIFPFVCGGIAYLIPNFGAFLSLLGALMNSAVIYFLPNLLFLKVVDSSCFQRSWARFMLSYALCTALVGTYASLVKMSSKS